MKENASQEYFPEILREKLKDHVFRDFLNVWALPDDHSDEFRPSMKQP